MPKKNLSKVWAERCAKSEGKMIMVPKSMLPALKELQKKDDDMEEKIAELNKQRALDAKFASDFWQTLRAEVEKVTGKKEVWSMDIGINFQAQQEGVSVVSLTPRQK